MPEFDVIYVTGPPATGKSTLLSALEAALQPMRTFSYSKELADQVGRRVRQEVSEEDMRRYSAAVIRPEDVVAVDEALISLAAQVRNKSHLVIDSHAVTKEGFGFRVTPFSLEQVARLAPTKIFMLYCEPTLVIERIQRNSEGRPQVTRFEAELHAQLQATVALTYGMHLGIPTYFLDTARPIEELVKEICQRLSTTSAAIASSSSTVGSEPS